MEAVIVTLLLAVLALICGYRLLTWYANKLIDDLDDDRHELD